MINPEWSMGDWVAGATLGLLGLAFAGIVGNAGWEGIKVALRWLLRTAYGGLTLWRVRALDEIYLTAAHTQSLVLPFFVFAGISIGATILTAVITADIIVLMVTGHRGADTPKLAETLDGWPRVALLAALVVILWVAVYAVVRGAALIASAIVTRMRFDWLLRALGPTLTTAREKKLHRDFAMMKSKSDYSQILLQLEEVDGHGDVLSPSERELADQARAQAAGTAPPAVDG